MATVESILNTVQNVLNTGTAAVQKVATAVNTSKNAPVDAQGRPLPGNPQYRSYTSGDIAGMGILAGVVLVTIIVGVKVLR